jgi:hypothetical protein
LECLLEEVFAKAYNECFVVDDRGGVAECAAFAEDFLAGLFFLFGAADVDVEVLEFNVVVFEVLFGHFAPYAGAEGVDYDLVLVVFTLNFGKRHNDSLSMVKVRLILTLLGVVVGAGASARACVEWLVA